MVALTPKLGLSKGQSADLYSLAGDINAAIAKIDDVCAPTLCTSNTRPAAPFNGQMIWETDKKRSWLYDSGLGKWLFVNGAAPYCVLERTTPLSVSPMSTWIPVSWDAQLMDSDNMFNPNVDATKIVAPYEGTYLCYYEICGAHSGGSEAYTAAVHNSTENKYYRGSSGFATSGTYAENFQLESEMYLAAGGQLTCVFRREGNTGSSFNDAASHATRLEVVMVSSFKGD